MELRGINTMPFAHTPAFATLADALASFGKAIEKLPENKPLREL